MGFLSSIGNWIWNGAKSIAGNFVDTSSFENAENRNFQANEAEKNRQFQEDMYQKQMDFTRDMWEDTNDWNSPNSQAQRWRDAGFNPFLMLQGSSTGSATSQSAPSGSFGSSPSGGSSGTRSGTAAQFMEMLTKRKVDKAQERFLNSQSAINEAEGRLADAKAQEILNGIRLDNYGKQTWNRYAADTYDASIKLVRQQEQEVASQTRLNKSDELYKEMVNKQIPEQLAADLAIKLTNNRYLNNLSKTEGYTQWQIMQGVVESSARELNIHLDNHQKKATMASLIDIIGSDSFWRGWNNFAKGFSDILGGLGSVLD